MRWFSKARHTPGGAPRASVEYQARRRPKLPSSNVFPSARESSMRKDLPERQAAHLNPPLRGYGASVSTPIVSTGVPGEKRSSGRFSWCWTLFEGSFGSTYVLPSFSKVTYLGQISDSPTPRKCLLSSGQT